MNLTHILPGRVPLDTGVFRTAGGHGVNRRGVEPGLYLGLAEDNGQVFQLFLPNVFNLCGETDGIAGDGLGSLRSDVFEHEPVSQLDVGRD